MHPKRKPSVRSRRREPVTVEDVWRAVLCECTTAAEIEAMTGGSPQVVARLLEQLTNQGLVRKTDAGYAPAGAMHRAG